MDSKRITSETEPGPTTELQREKKGNMGGPVTSWFRRYRRKLGIGGEEGKMSVRREVLHCPSTRLEQGQENIGCSDAGPNGTGAEVKRRERIAREGFPLRLPKKAELTEAEGWASKRLTAGFSDYVSAWCIQTDSGIPAVLISQLFVIAEKKWRRGWDLNPRTGD